MAGGAFVDLMSVKAKTSLGLTSRFADHRDIAELLAMRLHVDRYDSRRFGCSAKGCELEQLAHQADQRRVLIAVLLIKCRDVLVEFGAGLVAGARALMADTLDMLGDVLV